ncbi:MAG TPA: regulator [Pseudonocardia sp.]|jgi:AGZA family xanthine/uracil permease-like MFS transporter|nr:regulator [Pseudonocardia sp.]
MTTTARPEASEQPMKLSWWVAGDTNAFFGLGFNTLVNVLVLSGLCLGVLKIPGRDVFGVILPALGVQLLIGNVYYTYLARRLARREGRDDVCAMPYGPSVPHMFIVVFVIMLPIYLQTKDPVVAWTAGLAWCFIIGLIVLMGAFIGPYIRKYTPQAAMLGTLAGISIAFISMRPAAQMWSALWIAFPVMVIILIGFFTDLKLPGNIPVGLAALLVGTAIGWIGGYMSAPDVVTAAKDVSLSLPWFDFARLGHGLANVAPLLATAIPLGIYNFTEGMTNVESASVAGDSYNLRAILGADGVGALVGACLGCPFPPAVYIGHPGWKAAGGRTSYSLASGVFIALMCFFGMFALLGALLPMPAIVPILLYIGLLIGAQAFQETPKAHAVAVVFALIPNIASWAGGLMTNAVLAAGSTPDKIGEQGFEDNGIVYHGMLLLGGGAILAGMILGAIVAFIIDKNFLPAAVYCFIGAALGFIGLIHAEHVGWNVGGQVALGYLFAGIVLLGFWLFTRFSEAAGPGSEAGAEPKAEASDLEEAVPAPRSADEPEAATPAPSTA